MADFTSPYSEELQEALKNDFPLLQDQFYLDNAGAALYSQSQLGAVHRDLQRELIPSPHSSSSTQQRIKIIRQLILSHFHTDLDSYAVVFTANATAAIKLVGESFCWGKGSKFACAREAHTSGVGIRELAVSAGAEFVSLSREDILNGQWRKAEGSSLAIFPAMSNFCGFKFPLSCVSRFQDTGYRVLLDAAALVSTNPLDLELTRPDFVCVSFYKLFGYPTGLGALIARRDALADLRQVYFGGGSVEMHLVQRLRHQPRSTTEEAFEGGTLPFLQILSLTHGFAQLQRVGGMSTIAEHTFRLAKYLSVELRGLKHPNGQPLVLLHSESDYSDSDSQGAIVTFNLLKPDGCSHYGFNAFARVAREERVNVRTGCFCNVGACQRYLELHDEEIERNFAAGHVCGDDVDVLYDKPVGAIRVSFGYYNTRRDADKVLQILRDNFLRVADTVSTAGEATATISVITLFPIKSCAPMRVARWRVTKSGLAFDRQWAVTRAGKCMTQKKIKALCMIQPRVDLKSMTLCLSYPGINEITLDIGEIPRSTESYADECAKGTCQGNVDGVDCGDEVATWLDEALGDSGLRLIRQALTRSTSLANSAPFLLMNRASVSALAAKYSAYEGAREEFTHPARLLYQFRSNLVLDCDEAFVEDFWQRVTLNNTGTILERHSKCARCAMISYDQDSGEEIPGLVRTLSYMTDRGFCFGMLFKTAENADLAQVTIAVGDVVSVESAKDRLNLDKMS